MPTIRNLALIKRFTDYFRLKSFDSLDSQAGRMLVPVVSIPIPANIKTIIDSIANDQDKTITVPTGKQWNVLWLDVILATTASAGNRQVQLTIDDNNGAELWRIGALNVQVASTSERYHYQKGIEGPSEATAGNHLIPLPADVILPEGYTLRFFEAAAISSTDDMTVRIVVDETDVEDR